MARRGVGACFVAVGALSATTLRVLLSSGKGRDGPSLGEGSACGTSARGAMTGPLLKSRDAEGSIARIRPAMLSLGNEPGIAMEGPSRSRSDG